MKNYLDRARSIAHGTGEWVIPTPRPAATVILLRDADEGPEVFVQHRSMSMPFAPGMSVFPGGRVEPIDEGSLAACAVRETFEETTVRLDESALVPWSRWVTPEVEDRRYDVAFYCAQLPADQHAENVTTEADRAEWLGITAVLIGALEGSIALLPPTLATIRELAVFDTVSQILSAPREIRPLMPRPLLAADEKTLIWAIMDVDTNELVRPMSGPPAGWESKGRSS
mgnify:CR=1 FL=1